jgi:predicted DNA-binding transcriptional regulator AlpA
MNFYRVLKDPGLSGKISLVDDPHPSYNDVGDVTASLPPSCPPNIHSQLPMLTMTRPADDTLSNAGLPRFGLSEKEVALYLGVMPKTIRRWVRFRGFPAPARINRKVVRYDLLSVRLWTMNNGRPVKP